MRSSKPFASAFFVPALLVGALASCAGTRQHEGHATAHAESFNLVGFQIPGGSYERAWENVPEDASVTTVRTNPSDWTSLFGVLNRILGVSYTEISYTE